MVVLHSNASTAYKIDNPNFDFSPPINENYIIKIIKENLKISHFYR